MSAMAPNTKTIAAATLRNKGMSSNISFLVGLSASMMLRIPREAETKCLTDGLKHHERYERNQKHIPIATMCQKKREVRRGGCQPQNLSAIRKVGRKIHQDDNLTT